MSSLLNDFASFAKQRAQMEAFTQLEDAANQSKAVDLIVAAPIGIPEKMKILSALDSISAQAKARLSAPAAGAPAPAPVPSVAAAGAPVGGTRRRRRHRRRTHKKFSS